MTGPKGSWTRLLHHYREEPNHLPFGLTDADARIADASKELLAALEECADWLCAAHLGTEQRERGQRARAAIAKARGEN